MWSVLIDARGEMIPTHKEETNELSGSIWRRFTSNRNVKSIGSVGAAVAALALLCALGVAQVGLDTRSSPATPMPRPGHYLSNALLFPASAGRVQAPAFAFALKPELKVQIVAPSNHLSLPSLPRNIPAGVYKTVPYSCIVVVPGPYPDDRCVVRPGGGDFSMPIIKPDLRFIPLRPAKK